MVKTFIILFGLLIFKSVQSQVLPDISISNGLKAVYKVEHRPDSMELDNYQTNYDVLFIDSGYNSSMYTTVKFVAMDSIKRVERMKGNPLGPDISWYMANGTKNTTVIYKDHIRQEVTAHEKLAPNESIHFIYKETDSMKWKLLDQYEIINTIKCYKAELEFGGRTWIAWYNPEIPIAEGPYKFNGLPGLIFQIEDKTESWKYELIRLSENKTSFLFNCSDSVHENVSKAEFVKAKKHHYENKVTIMKSQGYTIKDEKELRKTLSKDNNWIEL